VDDLEVAAYPALATALGTSLAALLGALLVHGLLRRLERRLAARRGGAPGTTVVLALAAPKLLAWLAALRVVTGQFELLGGVRDFAIWLVTASLRTPIFMLGDRRYAALDLLVLPALLVAVWAGVSLLARLVHTRVLRLPTEDAGAQPGALTVLRYVLTFVGSVVVLQVWGFDVSSLTVVLSVLGVGIGFGLQHIANNFVSGILIGVEKPIRPGDFVHVGAYRGTVQRIGARSTEIRTLDHVTILVPNSRLLESEVVNWSHRDPTSRIHVPISVAYGSDLERVCAALVEAVQRHRSVLAEPRPKVDLEAFGASGIELDVQVWIADPRAQHAIRSDLNFAIEATLRRLGVEIPFPQHDVRLRTPDLDRLTGALGARPDGAAAAG